MTARRRAARILLVVAAAAALAAAAIAVNLVLLRYADSRNDPVGKLTPRANVTQPSPPLPETSTSENGGRDREEPDD